MKQKSQHHGHHGTLNYQIPPQWRNWLLDERSLTLRLQQRAREDFHVELLGQRFSRPNANEARRLALPQRQLVLMRQVCLYCDGVAVVLAHSLIPLATLHGSLRRLKYLANRPLGAALFAYPQLRRSAFEIIQLSRSELPHYFHLAPTHPLLRSLQSEQLWGRRSHFQLGDKAVLVSEIFLPSLTELPNRGNLAAS
ncbi:MAG: chorismate lyase [Gammaproteobacteria bacterium]|nr:chorismate lyase [Gammaproteobacteria bacterium]